MIKREIGDIPANSAHFEALRSLSIMPLPNPENSTLKPSQFQLETLTCEPELELTTVKQNLTVVNQNLTVVNQNLTRVNQSLARLNWD